MIPQNVPEMDNNETDVLLSRIHPYLNVQLLTNIIESVYAEDVSRVSDFEPPATAGWIMYAKVTGGLRYALEGKHGWKMSNKDNIASIENLENRTAIVCSGGDSGTGRVNQTPATRGAKGEATAQLWGQQVIIFPDLEVQVLPGLSLWVLLVYIDDLKGEIRVELSLPARITKRKQITEWTERIILPAISISGAAQVGRNDPPDDESDIDIDITRKII